MGTCTSRAISKGSSSGYTWKKKNNNNNDDPRMFIHKVKQLEQEINAMLQGREEESEAYERELLQFALKEAGWKKERKRLRDEVRRLRKSVAEKEERIRSMEGEVDQIVVGGGKCGEGKSSLLSSVESGSVCVTTGGTGSSVVSMSLIELMKEERARRDETVVKWKMLYLDIKNELDELIHKTTHRGTMYRRTNEEDMVEKMQIELKAKDEIIEILKAEIISMENNEYTRKREVDILRQSLKIMSNKKVATLATYVNKRRSKGLIRFNKSLTKFTLVKQNVS